MIFETVLCSKKMKKHVFKSEQSKRRIYNYYSFVLKECSIPVKSKVLIANGVRTHLLEAGSVDKPGLFLVHGSGSNALMWLSCFELLAKKYHIIACDIPGECGKSETSYLNYRDDSYADWMAEILGQVKLKDLQLVGCSLGGWIALKTLSKYPKLVKKLVLFSSAGIVNVRFNALMLIGLTALSGEFGFKRLNQKVYGSVNLPPEYLIYARLIKENFNPRTDQLPLLKNKELKKIKQKVVYYGGDSDCFYRSDKAFKRLDALLVNFKGHLLKNKGHVISNMAEILKMECYETT